MITIGHILIILILLALNINYLYILTQSYQPKIFGIPPNFVIPEDTIERYQIFLNRTIKERQYSSSFYDDDYDYDSNSNATKRSYKDWGKNNKEDDFFLKDAYGDIENKESNSNFLIPSQDYHCYTSWLTIRSTVNYKFLWIYADESYKIGATATMETPIHLKSFYIQPIIEDCTNSSGWVTIQINDNYNHGYLYMIPPNHTSTDTHDEWSIRIQNITRDSILNDYKYHFLFEKDGYIFNRGLNAYLNVISASDYLVKGHSNSWDTSQPAGREYSAEMKFRFLNTTKVIESEQHEQEEVAEALKEDTEHIKYIQQLPKSTEKRVIAFGLYGNHYKYTLGAIRNAELINIYFPGWIPRYYVTSDVSTETITKLKNLGSEIENIPSNMGYISGMFYRFLIACDPSIDRFIIRDVDSRLNARDRLAVEEWIISKAPIHIIRDHVNHCLVMNGGLWGGTKNCIPQMKDLIENYTNRDTYGADLDFLRDKIWPLVKDKQMSHDSYCCEIFPNTHPFPTRRYVTYQHIGQVFDEYDHPRLLDIDGYIRGKPIPNQCRKEAEWIYG